MSSSEGLSIGRTGDFRSHHRRLVVDGNIAYHLMHNVEKSRNKSRKRCEHRTLLSTASLDRLTIGLQAHSQEKDEQSLKYGSILNGPFLGSKAQPRKSGTCHFLRETNATSSPPAESALHETPHTRLESLDFVGLVCRPATAMATARSLAALSSARATTRLGSLRAGACPPRVAARAAAAAEADSARRLVAEFYPAVPLDAAVTPPSGWYTEQDFLRLELDRVFLRGWQAVGHIWQVKNPNDFFTGRLGNVEFIVCRDANGNLHAFHNVCRHHASLLACGSGQKTCFQCPYHGWTYGLDGTLLKATRISGIKNFNKNDFGLVPIKMATWGPFVLARFDDESTEDDAGDVVGDEWLGSASELLSTNGIDTSLPHICRREYVINCNWKVFCDNYLDGGYHVPYAHGALASGLQLQSYETLAYERVSVQRCESASSESDDFKRLGTKALYAFVYPNFMINRYGPWMDTNLAVPLGSTKCKVVFDYFLDKSLLDDLNFIKRSLKDSEQVQMEDIALCEGVQRGLESPAYSIGRYAPSVEMAMHHFHCLLHANLSG